MNAKARFAPLILALALLGGRASADGSEDPPLPPLPPLPSQAPSVGIPLPPLPPPSSSQQGAHPPTGKIGTGGSAQTPETQPVPPSAVAPNLLPTTPQPSTPGATNPSAPDNFAASTTGAGTQGDAPGSNLSATSPAMIGDAVGPRAFAQFPNAPPPNQPFPPGRIPGLPRPQSATARSAAFVPSVRGLKIAENQSPRPQDRVFFSFNYFSDVNGPVNRQIGSPLRNMQVYREIWGFEKTFAEGNGSFGLRIPLDTLSSGNVNRGGPGGSSTSVGDLSIFGKYILLQNTVTGSLISAGMVVTAPTGPSSFAGANYLGRNIHSTDLQPFLGYIWNKGNFYTQGFTAVDVSLDPNQSTFLYNDVAIGYYVYRSSDPHSFITAVAPTFEAHVTTPLNHRDYANPNDPGASYDVVNLTYGLNIAVGNRSMFTLGYVSPVTGPRPFSNEALLLYNFRFGGSRNRQQFLTPPVTSG